MKGRVTLLKTTGILLLVLSAVAMVIGFIPVFKNIFECAPRLAESPAYGNSGLMTEYVADVMKTSCYATLYQFMTALFIVTGIFGIKAVLLKGCRALGIASAATTALTLLVSAFSALQIGAGIYVCLIIMLIVLALYLFAAIPLVKVIPPPPKKPRKDETPKEPEYEYRIEPVDPQ